ncbi:MAG TPA: glycerophosphodiester phosphodiesterase [Capsulimonadaceae bacterium]|nr:glycerophosphodiester phosphodiesterase [Capsulimonadaceae bacterium]
MSRIRTYLRIGYRGAAGLCPPGNTVASLWRALEVGANMLQVDVRVTQDNALILSHEVIRMVDEHEVPYADRTLAEWRKLSEGTDAPIATLQEALTLTRQANCGLMMMIRDAGIENALARALRQCQIPPAHLLVGIPSESSRVIMNALDPNIPLAHVLDADQAKEAGPAVVGKLQTDAVVWAPQLITRDRVRALKTQGIVVYTGPVYLAEEMRRLRNDCGVDGILTGFPDILAAV